MADEPTASEIEQDAPNSDSTSEQVTEDVLVEEVSIDGMCGVY